MDKISPYSDVRHLRNEFDFWKVHGIMSIHDSMNLTKIEFIAYIYILYYQSRINFQFSNNDWFPRYFELNQR